MVAKARPDGDETYRTLVDSPAAAWVDRRSGNTVASHDHMGFAAGTAVDIIEQETARPGRYILSVSRPHRAGHSVIVQRSSDGVMEVIDVQSGTLYKRDSIPKEFGDAHYVNVTRIDNADINVDAIADFIEVA